MASETARGADAGASNLADERGAAVYAVELPIFEGPLDLLLHVVRRHELDILDIPIAFITEKYLEYLDMMRALDIEIAGDYLVMAATLAYLKSRELVPQREEAEGEAEGEGEEGEDPREALIRRLVEYERYRAASRELDSMPVRGRDVFLRGREIDLPPLDPGMAPVTLFRLAEAYSKVLQRAKISKSHEVVLEPITVRQRMEQLSLLLEERGVVEFESLFLGRSWGSELELRQMLVVTLMSVLELVKLGIIGVDQVTETEAIRLRRRASHAAAIQAMTGYDEASSFGTAATPGAGAGPSAPPQPLVGVAGAASEGRDEAADEVVDEVAVDAASDEVERAGDAGAGDDEEEDEEDVVEAEVTAWLTRDEPERRARAAAGEGASLPAIPWTEAGGEAIDVEEEAALAGGRTGDDDDGDVERAVGPAIPWSEAADLSHDEDRDGDGAEASGAPEEAETLLEGEAGLGEPREEELHVDAESVEVGDPHDAGADERRVDEGASGDDDDEDRESEDAAVERGAADGLDADDEDEEGEASGLVYEPDEVEPAEFEGAVVEYELAPDDGPESEPDGGDEADRLVYEPDEDFVAVDDDVIFDADAGFDADDALDDAAAEPGDDNDEADEADDERRERDE